jgi:hypothetical protein
MPRPPRPGLRRRTLLQTLASSPLWLAVAWPGGARAQNVELSVLKVERDDGALRLDFAIRLNLPRAVDDTLHRGVPLYFVAEAALYRPRWYWRDERVARVRRTWRLAYQPLTSAWRVSLGALSQTYASLSEALAALSAAGGWQVADLSALPEGEPLYLRFSYELDTSQLPSPMQISLGGQADWVLRLERELPVPARGAGP